MEIEEIKKMSIAHFEIKEITKEEDIKEIKSILSEIVRKQNNINNKIHKLEDSINLINYHIRKLRNNFSC